jgi:mannose-6-phosphate isomerase-like protein (cupin superfamily)
MRSILIGLLLVSATSSAQPSSTRGAQPQTVSIVALVERELISKNEPRSETLIACSGNTRTTLVQLNQDQPRRLYDAAEMTYYVIAGEGALQMGDRETAIAPGSLVALPRGTGHGMLRKGKRPLILLATLSGSPCEQLR